jgi:CBS domain-containing membrane protein
MSNKEPVPNVTMEDLRDALRKMKTYVDITEEDLKRIYELAIQHAREKADLRVPVKDVMTNTVVFVKRDADLHEAARILSENRISGMPVVDDNNRVIGVISEADLLTLAGVRHEHVFKDILRHILGEPVSSGNGGNRVEDVMSFPPITSMPDDDIADVANILDEKRIKRLPVVNAEGILIGIVSRADIVKSISKRR